jgi:hypothetical protein
VSSERKHQPFEYDPEVVQISPERTKGIQDGCPACISGAIHNSEEWTQFHPKAGTGTIETYSIKGENK